MKNSEVSMAFHGCKCYNIYIVNLNLWGGYGMIKNLFRDIKESLKKGAIYLILEGLVIIIIWLVNLGFIEKIFSVVISGLIIEQWVNYKIKVKEIALIHVCEKEGKNFNKEYYDLYWNSMLIRIRFLLAFEYIALSIYTKIYNVSMDSVEDIATSVMYGFVFLMLGCFFWIFWLKCFLDKKEERKLHTLIGKKKDNFDSYTEEEKKILENLLYKKN